MDQLAFLGGPAREYFIHQQQDPDALTSLAKRTYIRDDDLENALFFYRRALGSLSVHIPAWIGTAEIEAESGAHEKAVSISNHIDAISPNNGQWRWLRTMLAYTLEQETMLAANLSWFIENNFGKRVQAITLAESVWPNYEELISKIGMKNSPHLLHFYIKRQEVEKVTNIWETVLQNHLTDTINLLWLVNFFISNKEIKEAEVIWNRFFEKDDTLLTNCRFQNELVWSGFDWRLSKPLRNLLSQKEGELTIAFSGTENIGFNLHQLVPLSPGMTYSLSGIQKGKELTTDQKPYWAVSSYKCEKMYHKTSMVNSTTEWQDFLVIFTVPDSCDAVWISVMRNKSYHFDNRISGEFSIKNLNLVQVVETDTSEGIIH